MPVIFPFGEGKTEQVVFNFLMENLFPEKKLEKLLPVNGKGGFPRQLRGVVGHLEENDEARILAFRDLDADDTVEGIVASFGNLFMDILKEWRRRRNLQAAIPLVDVKRLHDDYTIFQWEVAAREDEPGLRLVLHIESHHHLPEKLRNFANKTTDTRILALGLGTPVLQRFIKENSLGCGSDVLSRLIQTTLPDTMTKQAIPFDQDKDYLAAYLMATRFWVKQRTDSKETLAHVILRRAWKRDRVNVERSFEGWRIAIEKVQE